MASSSDKSTPEIKLVRDTTVTSLSFNTNITTNTTILMHHLDPVHIKLIVHKIDE